MAKGQAGKNKCAIDITAAIASAGIAASLITISAMALFKLPLVLVNEMHVYNACRQMYTVYAMYTHVSSKKLCVCVCALHPFLSCCLFTLFTLHSSLDSFLCFIMFDQCSSETHTLRCHQLPGILGVHWNHGQEVLCCVHHRLGGGCQLHRDPGSVFESSNHRRVGEMR